MRADETAASTVLQWRSLKRSCRKSGSSGRFRRRSKRSASACCCTASIYKAAIDDTLAHIADPVFANIGQYDAHALLTATVAFYGQLYFDFAGYSSMAIGTARLFGYRFPRNFNWPYRAASVTEFWRRWQM